MSRETGVLTEAQLSDVERRFTGGLTSRQVLEVFEEAGLGLTEATFRKYVQLGLLPRSRRVGRKGKFKGSQGIYPVGTVRRLNLIRRMMAQDLTLEQIQRSFHRFKDRIEELEEQLERLLADLEQAVRAQPLAEDRRRALLADLTSARRTARTVVRRLERVEASVALAPEPEEAEPSARGGLKERRP